MFFFHPVQVQITKTSSQNPETANSGVPDLLALKHPGQALPLGEGKRGLFCFSILTGSNMCFVTHFGTFFTPIGNSRNIHGFTIGEEAGVPQENAREHRESIQIPH